MDSIQFFTIHGSAVEKKDNFPYFAKRDPSLEPPRPDSFNDEAQCFCWEIEKNYLLSSISPLVWSFALAVHTVFDKTVDCWLWNTQILNRLYNITCYTFSNPLSGVLLWLTIFHVEDYKKSFCFCKTCLSYMMSLGKCMWVGLQNKIAKVDRQFLDFASMGC